MRKYYWEFIAILEKNGYLYRDYWKNDDGTYTYKIDTDPEFERRRCVSSMDTLLRDITNVIPWAKCEGDLIKF